MRSYTIAAPAIEYYADTVAQFEHLLGRLTHAAAQRMNHGELEAMVQAEGGELLRRMVQGHLDQRSAQEPIRERVVGEDGTPRTHRREACRRCLETRFGEVIVTRRGYGGRGLDSVFPLDAELNLPPDKYSHGLREVLVEEVVRGSFDGVRPPQNVLNRSIPPRIGRFSARTGSSVRPYWPVSAG